MELPAESVHVDHQTLGFMPVACQRYGTTDGSAEVEQVIALTIGERCVPVRPKCGMRGRVALAKTIGDRLAPLMY
jgi:hypothetical protein